MPSREVPEEIRKLGADALEMDHPERDQVWRSPCGIACERESIAQAVSAKVLPALIAEKDKELERLEDELAEAHGSAFAWQARVEKAEASLQAARARVEARIAMLEAEKDHTGALRQNGLDAGVQALESLRELLPAGDPSVPVELPGEGQVEEAAEVLAIRFWELRTFGEELPPWNDLPEDARTAKVGAAENFIRDRLLPALASTQLPVTEPGEDAAPQFLAEEPVEIEILSDRGVIEYINGFFGLHYLRNLLRGAAENLSPTSEPVELVLRRVDSTPQSPQPHPGDGSGVEEELGEATRDLVGRAWEVSTALEGHNIEPELRKKLDAALAAFSEASLPADLDEAISIVERCGANGSRVAPSVAYSLRDHFLALSTQQPQLVEAEDWEVPCAVVLAASRTYHEAPGSPERQLDASAFTAAVAVAYKAGTREKQPRLGSVEEPLRALADYCDERAGEEAKDAESGSAEERAEDRGAAQAYASMARRLRADADLIRFESTLTQPLDEQPRCGGSGELTRVEMELEGVIRRAYSEPIVPAVEGEDPKAVEAHAAASVIQNPDRMRHLATITTAVLKFVQPYLTQPDCKEPSGGSGEVDRG